MCKCDIQIRSPGGHLEMVHLKSKQALQQTTARQLKEEAMKKFGNSGCYLGEIRLVVEGKPVEDESLSLSDCGVRPSSPVQMVTKVEGG